MENSTYLFADDTKIIGSQMNLFSLQNDLNSYTKWSKENRLEFNNAKFEAICFDLKKLDQSGVHLYADDIETTCKTAVNDLGIIITNNFEMGQSYQWAAIEGTTIAFFLEEKRSFFYKYESRNKFKLKLHFIDSPLRVKRMVPQLAKLQKTRKEAKTSAQVVSEQEIFYRWWVQSEPHLQQFVANQFSFGSKWSSYA